MFAVGVTVRGRGAEAKAPRAGGECGRTQSDGEHRDAGVFFCESAASVGRALRRRVST